MTYLRNLNIEKLKKDFEKADKQLKLIFHKYPHPNVVEGCPHCVDVNMQDNLLKGEFSSYLWKAMSTWGTENDFKYYIPELFNFVYTVKDCDDIYMLFRKLNYVKNWTQEEIQAILSWFNAYCFYIFIGDFNKLIESSRLNVHEFLSGNIDKLSCEFPLSFLYTYDFNEMMPYLNPELLDNIFELLDTWPIEENDFIAYAYCVKSGQMSLEYDNKLYKKRYSEWVIKNNIKLEEFFWKTNNPYLQQLFSDVLTPRYY